MEAHDALLDRRLRSNCSTRSSPTSPNPERFRREARARELSHPNVVSIYDVGEDPRRGRTYIVMELVEGENLKERTDAPRRWRSRDQRIGADLPRRSITPIDGASSSGRQPRTSCWARTGAAADRLRDCPALASTQLTRTGPSWAPCTTWRPSWCAANGQRGLGRLWWAPCCTRWRPAVCRSRRETDLAIALAHVESRRWRRGLNARLSPEPRRSSCARWPRRRPRVRERCRPGRRLAGGERRNAADHRHRPTGRQLRRTAAAVRRTRPTLAAHACPLNRVTGTPMRIAGYTQPRRVPPLQQPPPLRRAAQHQQRGRRPQPPAARPAGAQQPAPDQPRTAAGCPTSRATACSTTAGAQPPAARPPGHSSPRRVQPRHSSRRRRERRVAGATERLGKPAGGERSGELYGEPRGRRATGHCSGGSRGPCVAPGDGRGALALARLLRLASLSREGLAPSSQRRPVVRRRWHQLRRPTGRAQYHARRRCHRAAVGDARAEPSVAPTPYPHASRDAHGGRPTPTAYRRRCRRRAHLGPAAPRQNDGYARAVLQSDGLTVSVRGINVNSSAISSPTNRPSRVLRCPPAGRHDHGRTAMWPCPTWPGVRATGRQLLQENGFRVNIRERRDRGLPLVRRSKRVPPPMQSPPAAQKSNWRSVRAAEEPTPTLVDRITVTRGWTDPAAGA